MQEFEVSGNMTRRDALRVLGAATIAGRMAFGAEAAGKLSLKEKAKKNLKLGLMTHEYGLVPVEEVARRVKEAGCTGVVCRYQGFKDAPFDFAKPDWKAVDQIRSTFERKGIEIAGLFGYYNVVDPHEDKRKQGEAAMEVLLKNWKRFGSPIVSTETGTLNKESEREGSPENDTEAAYVKCREAFKRLAGVAEKAGSVVAIEGYWRHVIGSAERAERLIKEVDSPALKITMDPCNYFRNEDIPQMQTVLKDIYKRIGRQTALAHAKDVKAAPNGSQTPAAGTGVLDYPLFLRLLAELDKPLWLILEHVKPDDVPRAKKYVEEQFEKI